MRLPFLKITDNLPRDSLKQNLNKITTGKYGMLKAGDTVPPRDDPPNWLSEVKHKPM